ncbi:MAG: hypothetical protein ACLVKR_02025 [Lachnospiraceae bacterium]
MVGITLTSTASATEHSADGDYTVLGNCPGSKLKSCMAVSVLLGQALRFFLRYAKANLITQNVAIIQSVVGDDGCDSQPELKDLKS